MSRPWIEACDCEPAHAPNATQSWGALLIAGENDLVIRHASANMDAFIGCTATSALGHSLDNVLGPAAATAIAAGRTAGLPAPAPIPGITRAASGLAASCHRVDGLLYVTIEPAIGENTQITWAEAHKVVEDMRDAADLASLFAIAATALRRATGFDRALVYRFDPAGHGEVVAEECAPDLEPFLGLHYPASSVPREARQLHLRQRVRILSDTCAEPVPLLAPPGMPGSPDLSLCTVRAASPIHLDTLRSMGVHASIAVSLTIDGTLWGMLVGHHRARQHLGPETRALADLIGQVASMRVSALRDTEARNDTIRRRARVANLSLRLCPQGISMGDLGAGLARHGKAVLALCAASGALIRIAGSTISLGDAPHGLAADRLLERLLSVIPDTGNAFTTSELGKLLQPGEAEAINHPCAGALLLPLINAPGDCIAWLRPEHAHRIRWVSDPRLPGEAGVSSLHPSPLRSFAVWEQEIRGRAPPWRASEIEAAQDFRREIDRLLVSCAAQEIARLRQHDALTGLANRRLLREWLESWVDDRQTAFLISVEIDRFKSLSEAIGEQLCDGVLLEAARRIEAIARTLGGQVARTDPSTFGVLCRGVDAIEATQLAVLLRSAIADPFDIGGERIRITASVGIAPATPTGMLESADVVLADAETALQSARAQGGNTVQIFSKTLRAGASRRMEIEQELRALLGRDHERAGRFRVLYQPCVSLAGSRPENALAPDAAARAPLRGFEALLRWQHPRLGNVPPDEFIGIAEACGLIEAIGDWVLQEVIDQLAAWRGLWGGMAQPDWRIAVNVSPLQLTRPGFSADLMDKLAAHGLPPQCLTLEVTEGVFADQRASDMLAGFRKAGIKIAVDDFGVGYSSLSYLRHLPADELKLDRSFLQRNDGGPLHEDMLGALVQLARAVGFSVLAEGVETEEHLTAVAAAGCDAAQGWLFAKALPPAEAAQWIVQANPNALPDQAKPRMPFSFRDIVAAVNEAVIVTAVDHDEGGPGIVYVNPAFTRMTGWPLVDILGKPTRFLRGPETDVKVIEEFWNTLRMGQPAHARVVSYARSGMSFWCEMRAAPLRDQHGEITHYVAIARDVSHEMCRLDDLETLVERDTLTGIANSLGLEKFAAGLTAEDRRLLCVAYIDIDGFKTINATLGNAAGDAVLLGMADIICQNIRRADFVGRIGDDQFVICMPCQPLAEARQVAERLRRAISVHAFETPAGPVRVPCSLGVAAAHRADHGLTDAIARARVALCKARSSGRGALVEDLAVPG